MSRGGIRLNSGKKRENLYNIKGVVYGSLQEAADATGVNRSTVLRWVKSDKRSDCFIEGKQKIIKKIDKKEVEKQAEEEKLTPLEFMLKIMNDENKDVKIRAQMANWAAPYLHPKATGNKGKKEEQEENAKKMANNRFKPAQTPLRVIK